MSVARLSSRVPSGLRRHGARRFGGARSRSSRGGRMRSRRTGGRWPRSSVFIGRRGVFFGAAFRRRAADGVCGAARDRAGSQVMRACRADRRGAARLAFGWTNGSRSEVSCPAIRDDVSRTVEAIGRHVRGMDDCLPGNGRFERIMPRRPSQQRWGRYAVYATGCGGIAVDFISGVGDSACAVARLLVSRAMRSQRSRCI